MPGYLKIDQNLFFSQHWQSEDRKHGIMADSESFPQDLRYVIKNNALMLMGFGNGVFVFDLSVGQLLAREIYAMSEVWQRQNKVATETARLGARDVFRELKWGLLD